MRYRVTDHPYFLREPDYNRACCEFPAGAHAPHAAEPRGWDQDSDVLAERSGPGPCPCVCNSGGFCGGCGHAGCGRR